MPGTIKINRNVHGQIECFCGNFSDLVYEVFCRNIHNNSPYKMLLCHHCLYHKGKAKRADVVRVGEPIRDQTTITQGDNNA